MGYDKYRFASVLSVDHAGQIFSLLRRLFQLILVDKEAFFFADEEFSEYNAHISVNPIQLALKKRMRLSIL